MRTEITDITGNVIGWQEAAPPPASYILPKRVILDRLFALGGPAAVVAFGQFLDSNGGLLRLYWDSVPHIASDDSLFLGAVGQAGAALGLTEEQVRQVIAP